MAVLFITGQCAHANECKVPQETDTPCHGLILPQPLAVKGLTCLKTQDKTKERLQLDVDFQKEQVEICQIGAEETLVAFEDTITKNNKNFNRALGIIERLDVKPPWWKSSEAFYWYGVASGVAVTAGGALAIAQVNKLL